MSLWLRKKALASSGSYTTVFDVAILQAPTGTGVQTTQAHKRLITCLARASELWFDRLI